MSTNLEEVKFHYEQLCWLIERTDTVEQLILLKEVCAGFQLKERKGFYEECDCGEKLLICDSGMKLCSVGCKDKYVYTKKEDEKIICVDCNRDFTDECDGRSSFDEIGKIQCEDCFLKEKEDEMTQHEAVEFSNIQDDWNDKKTEDEKKDWWMAHNGRIEFVTATEKEVEEEGADEWGAIRHFVDKRESAVDLTKEEEDEEEKVEVREIIVDGKKYYYDEKTRQLYNPETSEEEGFLPDYFRVEDEETKCEKCNEKGILMYNDILCVWCAKKD
tara:strand:+ start:1967 stop:2785 length:819 start_codon:yes stop_codon:yes gene_type:complete